MSAATPRVSVVIPAHRAAATIESAVGSALAQTLREIEVIVVDDGSPDDTAAIVARIAARDPRVVLVRQRNRGVAAARNAGIARARAELVAPLDHDDVWLPHKLERQVARFEADPELGFVYGWSTIIDARGATIGAAPPWRVEGHVLPQLVWVHFTGSASCPLFRKDALVEVGGYDGGLRDAGAGGCEDWDVVLRLAERFEVGVVPAYVVAYRRVPGSMSADGGALARSYEVVMERVRKAHPELPEALFRWSRSYFFTYLAGVCEFNDQHARALDWRLRALRDDPLPSLSAAPLRDLAASALRAGVAAMPFAEGARTWIRSGGARRAPRIALDVSCDRLALPWERPRPSLCDRVQRARWRRIEAWAQSSARAAP